MARDVEVEAHRGLVHRLGRHAQGRASPNAVRLSDQGQARDSHKML